jgi:hypothetical protein
VKPPGHSLHPATLSSATGNTIMSKVDISERHEHVDRHGSVHQCWHECKSEMRRPAFWVLNILLTFLLFPLEHAIYTHLAPFTWVTDALGLS